MAHSIHARTSAEFLADAARRAAHAEAQPHDAGACDEAIAAIEAGLAVATDSPTVYVEARTLGGGMVRRHGPFPRNSEACSHAFHAEECAALAHNRMRRHDDASCQRVRIVPGAAKSGPHPLYNRTHFPHFVCNHGNWDICAANSGYCAAIPTPSAARDGCRATHFGDAAYVLATLGVTVMVPQVAQQAQARAASPILQRLAEANARLAGWTRKLNDPSKFQPIMKAEWDRAFDAREALQAIAVQADPVAYVRAYPGHAMAYRYLLPVDMVERIEAAETDAEMVRAVAPMVPQVAQQAQACAVAVTWRNDNPGTVWNRLAARLGRQPTGAEARAEVRRILAEARR